MRWNDFLDLIVLLLLCGGVILHAQEHISDFMISLIAAPSMFYIMVLSEIIRRKTR